MVIWLFQGQKPNNKIMTNVDNYKLHEEYCTCLFITQYKGECPSNESIQVTTLPGWSVTELPTHYASLHTTISKYITIIPVKLMGIVCCQ